MRARDPKPSHGLWLAVAIGAAAVLTAAGGIHLALPFLTRPASPDSAAIGSALAGQLPPFVHLTSTALEAVERDTSQPEPVFNVRFKATGQLASTVYLGGRVEDEILFLTDPAAQGTPVTVSGVGVLRRVGDSWNTQLTIDQQPLFDAATPDAFPGRQVIVGGSPEEAAYLAQRQRARVAAEQQAAAAELLRQAELAQREAHRIAEQAAAERVREALRQQQLQQAALAEQRRLEDEERARTAEAETRRREEEARARADEASRTALVMGRIPRNQETTVRLLSALRSDQVRVEDRFETVTIEDITVEGRVLVPAGATVRGLVSAVQPATRTSRTARLSLSFDLLTIGSQSVPIRAKATRVLSGPGLKGDVAKIGIGAGVGALIGGLLGGAQGAAIGGAVGGGGTLAATEGREIDLQPGSTIRIKFDEVVDIRLPLTRVSFQ